MVFFLDAHIKALFCGKVSDSYLQYFLRYELLSSVTDAQTESDAYEPTEVGSMSQPCNTYAQVGSKMVFGQHCLLPITLL